MTRIPADLIVRRRRSGDVIARIPRLINPDDPAELDAILLAAVVDDGWDRGRAAEFEMEIRPENGRPFTHPPEDDARQRRLAS